MTVPAEPTNHVEIPDHEIRRSEDWRFLRATPICERVRLLPPVWILFLADWVRLAVPYFIPVFFTSPRGTSTREPTYSSLFYKNPLQPHHRQILAFIHSPLPIPVDIPSKTTTLSMKNVPISIRAPNLTYTYPEMNTQPSIRLDASTPKRRSK